MSPDKSAVAVGLSNGVIKVWQIVVIFLQVFFLDNLAADNNFISLSSPEEKQSCNDLKFVDGTKKLFLRHYQDILAVCKSTESF